MDAEAQHEAMLEEKGASSEDVDDTSHLRVAARRPLNRRRFPAGRHLTLFFFLPRAFQQRWAPAWREKKKPLFLLNRSVRCPPRVQQLASGSS